MLFIYYKIYFQWWCFNLTEYKDIKLSNIKGVLIFLVVFGHVIENYKSEMNELFLFIYAFHMPLFIVISGYFSKRSNLKKIINFLLLYSIFQLMYMMVYFIGGIPSSFDVPVFHLWYIISMIFWYCIALTISKMNLKKISKIIVFFVLTFIAFISRWYANDIESTIREFYSSFYTYTLSYQRTITFLPFFLIGYFLDSEKMKNIYGRLNIKISIMLLLITACFTFIYAHKYPITEAIFRGSFGKNDILLNGSFLEYIIQIFLHYLLSAWLCYLILNIVQDKKNIFTKLGDNSLTIFLFHPLFVFALWKFDFFILDWNITLKLIFFFCLTIIICSILVNNIFVKFTKPICQPYFYAEDLLRKIKKQSQSVV